VTQIGSGNIVTKRRGDADADICKKVEDKKRNLRELTTTRI